jgi:DNA-binding IclR family transcriptional regulator
MKLFLEEKTVIIDNLEAPDAPIAVFDRMSTILDAFEDSGRLTLRQVVAHVGLPRSSVHRMLDQLVAKRWLRKVGREYELGMRLFELGSTVVQQNRLYAAAMPLLSELHRISGMVVHLGVLDGTDVVYLGKIGGLHAAAVPTRVGGRMAAHETALGRALLAYSENASAERDLPQSIRDDIERIRDFGLAYESGVTVAGLNCMATPIGPIGKAVAAVSICGPSSRLRLDHQSAVPLLTTATAIWQAVGQFGARSPEFGRRVRTLRSMPAAVGAWPSTCFIGDLVEL